MPTYCFRCPECGHNAEIVRRMSQAGDECLCDECGGSMERDYHAEKPNIGDREYSRPIHSDALAIMPHQVAEHKKRFPNIKLDSECRPVFDSYRPHDAYLKANGFVKNPQRKRLRGKKVATARTK